MARIPVTDSVFYRPLPQKVVNVVHRVHILCAEACITVHHFGVFFWIHCVVSRREEGGGGGAKNEEERQWHGREEGANFQNCSS
jgi:hypothetical protein